MDNTTIVVTKETFAKLNKVKQKFVANMAGNSGMTPRISNDQFISVLLDGRVTFDKTLK